MNITQATKKLQSMIDSGVKSAKLYRDTNGLWWAEQSNVIPFSVET